MIILAPPWPRSGSANIVAAQAAAHARRGARVLLVLLPLGREYSQTKVGFWQDALSAMAFPGVEAVTCPSTGQDVARSDAEAPPLAANDFIADAAHYAATGRMPAEVDQLIASARVDLIHANHVFSIPLAQRIAGRVQAAHGGWRPSIRLETHDIQSDAMSDNGGGEHRLDARGELLKTELAFCAQADALVHLTEADFDFFSSRLPGKRHQLIRPTLHPAIEAELVRRRGLYRRAEFDFIYVGNRHRANLHTLRWLLREVLPLAGASTFGRVRIIGTIAGLLKRSDPDLFERHASLFLGEVPSLGPFYTAAKVVLAPATAGTGASMKLIEAMCVGRPILTTSLALRGLPQEAIVGAGIHVHDTPAGFAQAMRRLGDSSLPAAAPDNAALYDRLFSNERYFGAFDDMSPQRQGRIATPG